MSRYTTYLQPPKIAKRTRKPHIHRDEASAPTMLIAIDNNNKKRKRRRRRSIVDHNTGEKVREDPS